jgi:HSP20 family protein
MSQVKELVSALSFFDSLFESMEKGIYDSSFPKLEVLSNFPPTNVSINKDTKDLRYEIAIAGYGPDDITLKFDPNALTIEANEVKKEKDGYFTEYHGIKQSRFSHSWYFPTARYDTDKASAKFVNGILIVDIPAKEETKPKYIQITT